MTISFGFSLFSHNHVNQTVTVLSIVGWLRWTTLCKSCSSQTRDTKVHNMQLCVASFSFIMENDRNPLSEISTNLPNSRGAQILSRSKRRQEEAAKHKQCRRKRRTLMLKTFWKIWSQKTMHFKYKFYFFVQIDISFCLFKNYFKWMDSRN